MKIIDIILILFLIGIILKQIKYIKELIIPTRKGYAEIITVFLSVIIFMWIAYNYANTWFHYVILLLCILTFISTWIKEGINSKGFASMYRYKEIIFWDEIQKVTIINSKNIKIKLTGGFMQQTFNFKKSDYDKIISILKENLPVKSQIEKQFK